MSEPFTEAGYPPIHLGHRRHAAIGTLRSLVALLRRERIDILHVHTGLDRNLGQLAAMLAGVSVVSHLHGCWVHFWVPRQGTVGLARRLGGRALGRSRDWVEHQTVRHYVAESATVKQLFLPLVGVPVTVLSQAVAEDRIGAAVARGAGHRLREELGVPATAKVLLTVSRMVEGKGHLDLLSAMPAIVRDSPAAVLVVVGDGDRRTEVEAEIRRLGLTERVWLLGDRFDVPELLAMADVFVFTSVVEGFGLAVLEAMAASLPVVAFRLPALEEFTVHGTTAHLVDLGDVAAFSSAVCALLADPARSIEMGQAARRLVEQRFSATSVARCLERVYEEVSGPGEGRPWATLSQSHVNTPAAPAPSTPPRA